MKAKELIRILQALTRDLKPEEDIEITVYEDLCMNELEIVDAIAYTNKEVCPKINHLSIRVLGLI